MLGWLYFYHNRFVMWNQAAVTATVQHVLLSVELVFCCILQGTILSQLWVLLCLSAWSSQNFSLSFCRWLTSQISEGLADKQEKDLLDLRPWKLHLLWAGTLLVWSSHHYYLTIRHTWRLWVWPSLSHNRVPIMLQFFECMEHRSPSSVDWPTAVL